MKNLAHSASFHFREEIAPSNPGTKHLAVQAANSRAKEEWKRVVGSYAKTKINEVREWYHLDDRALMATIYYFPPGRMAGEVDNIIKLILDGMISAAYLDDRCIEKVVAQKFEPGVPWLFSSPSPALQAAINMDKAALYIRVEDSLAWRKAS